MSKKSSSNSAESSRLFNSNLLEWFSKTHFTIPLFIFVPVALFFCWKTLILGQLSILVFTSYIFEGFFIWTFTEYVIHRFFHFNAKGKLMQKFHFFLHGAHHENPNDKKRVVMHPLLSIPLAADFYFVLGLLTTEIQSAAIFSGFIVGYLYFEMCHYTLHHANLSSPFWNKLKYHHMMHHYLEPDKGYGITTDFWDKVFRTDFVGDVR